jgi:fructose-1,6-bisphosphatase I
MALTSPSGRGGAVAAVIGCLARAAAELADLIAFGPLSGSEDKGSGVNSGGDRQIDLDIVANRLMCTALRKALVAAVVSEDTELPKILNPNAELCVAIDPLVGSANLANNVSTGTIFSIRPRSRDVLSAFFEAGTAQRAAGCFIYGPRIILVLAINNSVDVFTLDRRIGEFVLMRRGVRIPQPTPEFDINTSDHRPWNAAVHT